MKNQSKLEIVQVKADILAWSENFVEVPNPKLGGWAPCPFARRARIENRVDIRLGRDMFYDAVNCKNTWTDEYEVVVYVYEKNSYPVDFVVKLVAGLNQKILSKEDFLVLEDHPNSPEEVNGVCFNQGQYILLLFQRLSKVMEFSAFLKEKGYYDSWSREYYDLVVGQRMRNESADS